MPDDSLLYPTSFIASLPPRLPWDLRPLPKLLSSEYRDSEVERLERWYRELQSNEKEELKIRLRSLSLRDFYSAYYELMTARIALKIKASSVEHAAPLGNLRPDLKIAFPAGAQHIWEVATAFQPRERAFDDDRAHELARTLSEMFEHTWGVVLSATKFGTGGISLKKARPIITRWLERLDRGGDRHLALRRSVIDCEMHLNAYRLRDRVKPALIIVGLMGQGGKLDASERIRSVLRKKTRKYASLKELGLPLSVFVYEGDWLHISPWSVEGAIWGKQQVIFKLGEKELLPAVDDGGLFLPGPDGLPQNRGLSAVVYGKRVFYQDKVYASLRVYHHPYALCPVSDDCFDDIPQCRTTFNSEGFEKHWNYDPGDEADQGRPNRVVLLE